MDDMQLNMHHGGARGVGILRPGGCLTLNNLARACAFRAKGGRRCGEKRTLSLAIEPESGGPSIGPLYLVLR